MGTKPVMTRTVSTRGFGSVSDGRPGGKLPLCVFLLALLTLSSCGGGGGAPPPHQPEPPPPDAGGFTPDRELPVGFPATWFGGSSEERRVAGEEAARVSAMHRRGGTGTGQTVGVLDLGANPDHPDLEGQYAARCSMGLCNGTMGTADDGRPGLDRRDHSPVNDVEGHGTSIHGVIAAKRNGLGVYGVAYDAKIASWGNAAPVPWDDGTCIDCGFGAHQHVWGGIFDKQIARGMDWMRSLGVRATNSSWGRLYPWSLDRRLSASYVRRIMPASLAAFRSYVDAGGVAVWPAGNTRNLNPDVEAVLPRHFPELEKGWLAVAGLGMADGHIAFFSSYCGVAADWCIAAPAEVVTTQLSGLWNLSGGTSIAAPYVTASLAALKSMFPNLSYHDIRKRILVTADKSSPYDRTEIYGQGRLDLDAASRPVGGTNFALGALAADPVVPTGGTAVALPPGAIEHHLAGRTIVILDSYQRAPFEAGLDAFAVPRRSYLSLHDLALEPRRHRRAEWKGRAAMAATGSGIRAQGLMQGRSFLGFGQGEEVLQGLAELAGTPLPVSEYRMSSDAAGIAIGFSGTSGRWQAVAAAGGAERNGTGFGISGWNPGTVLAASFAPDIDGDASGAETFGVSLASDLQRPMGWGGSGALEVEGTGFEFAWKRRLVAGRTLSVDLTNRMTHLAVRSGPLLRFDDALVGSASLEASFKPQRFVTVAARFGAERPVTQVSGRIRAASDVDESGRLAYRDVAIDGRDLMAFERASLIVGYALAPNASFNLGIAAVRDGFGETETLAGFRTGLEF